MPRCSFVIWRFKVVFQEHKRHLNKPDEVYACDLVKRGNDWVILRYVSTREWSVADTVLPSGSQTLAYYQTGSDCVIWRMCDPLGMVMGHLFHVCSLLEVRECDVSYLDLMLDVWGQADGRVWVLDEDDVVASVAAGHLSEKQASAIAKIGCHIQTHWQALIDQLDQSLNGD